MSSIKRTRQRPSEAGATASLPPAKKLRTSQDSRPASSGLDYLVDDKQRAGKTIKANLTNGTIKASQNRPDETGTKIQSQSLAAEDDDKASDEEDVDSDAESSVVSDSSEDENVADGDEEMVDVEPALSTKTKALTNGPDVMGQHDKATTKDLLKRSSITKDDEDVEEDANEQATGPSFGDLVQAAYPETIDVQAAFAEQNPEAKALVPVDNSRNIQPPSATSLGTVLTQALRTNDKELLESCLQTKDVASIQSTIQRLHSPLVSTLLQRLAERLHKRPGRAGPLMTWIQWSLVAHGGYLAGQPQLTRKLKSLHQVVRERANSLQSLMTLKGKLDMLNAQIELRRSMQAQRTHEQSDDDEAAVVYIEGEEDESSDEQVSDDEVRPIKPKPSSRGKKVEEPDVDVIPSDDDDAVMVNGLDDDIEDDSDLEDDEDERGNGLIDDEAEETSDDEGDDASSEEDDSAEDLDDDEEEDDDDVSISEDEVPAAKQAKPKSRSSMARRR